MPVQTPPPPSPVASASTIRMTPSTTTPPASAPTRTATVLFAGGGTGGHIFPALAVAERLLDQPSAVEGCAVRCRFLCSTRAIDAEILSAETLPRPDAPESSAPVDYVTIPAFPPALRPRAFLRFISNWSVSVRAARAQIQAARAQGPVVVVAMGGFVAAPCVQAARVEKCPVIMCNLDATPGRANRWIAKHADTILNAAPGSNSVTFPGTTPWQPITPIVRRAALAPASPADCRRHFGLDPARSTLFVTGASLGAASVNGFLARFVEAHAADMRTTWQVIHQTGKGDIESTRKAYRDAGIKAVVEPFFREMGRLWGAADAAVSRAGAGSVAEAWANRVPTLFLPYPYHADQHQKRNAEPLVHSPAGPAALLAEDRIDPAATMESAGAALWSLLSDENARKSLASALSALPPVDGAERVAREVQSTLLEGRRR